ncbi:cytochrome P450 family protein [Abortiporus biennis]
MTILHSFIISFVFLLCIFRIISRKPRTLPPGPNGLPFIGNVHQLPIEYQEHAFAQMAKKYGNIIYLSIFGSPTIIVNSLHTAKLLLNDRSQSYSERPSFILLAELYGFKDLMLTMSYSNIRFRKQKRWIQSALSRTSILRYQPMIKRELAILLANLIQSPQLHVQHIWRYVGGIILESTYGHRVTTDDDELLQLATTAFTGVGSRPADMLVDYFPILKLYPDWLPGGGFKRHASWRRKLVMRSLDEPYEAVKRKVKINGSSDCLVGNLIQRSLQDGTLDADELDIIGAGGMLFGAGTETTVSAITTFFLAILRHPEVLQKLQQEMDRAVGKERLPDYEDRQSLPYLEASLLELYRYHTALSCGIPHYTTKDDVFQEYTIPAGSTVIPNIWAMAHSEETYHDPNDFIPERFLNVEASNLADIHPSQYTFGFGRRTCPGRDLADCILYITIASIVATLDVRNLKDKSGNDIIPPYSFVSGLARIPKTFEFNVSPRSEKSHSLIFEHVQDHHT